MRIVHVATGLITIPPNGWGAVERLIWEYKQNLEKLDVQIDIRYMNELAIGMCINSFRIFLSAGSRPIQEEDAAWRKHESETLNNNLNNQLMTSFFGKKNIEKKVDLTDLFNVVLLNDKTEEYLEAKVEKYISSWLDVTKHIDKLSLIKELVK